MKKSNISILIVLFIAAACTGNGQEANIQITEQQERNASAISPAEYHNQQATGKLYVIERDMPGVGNLTPVELQEASALSNNVLDDLGPEIKWIHSYVTNDKIYCVYSSPSEELIRKHAEASGFPSNVISETGTVIDPSTGE